MSACVLIRCTRTTHKIRHKISVHPFKYLFFSPAAHCFYYHLTDFFACALFLLWNNLLGFSTPSRFQYTLKISVHPRHFSTPSRFQYTLDISVHPQDFSTPSRFQYTLEVSVHHEISVHPRDFSTPSRFQYTRDFSTPSRFQYTPRFQYTLEIFQYTLEISVHSGDFSTPSRFQYTLDLRLVYF